MGCLQNDSGRLGQVRITGNGCTGSRAGAHNSAGRTAATGSSEGMLTKNLGRWRITSWFRRGCLMQSMECLYTNPGPFPLLQIPACISYRPTILSHFPQRTPRICGLRHCPGAGPGTVRGSVPRRPRVSHAYGYGCWASCKNLPTYCHGKCNIDMSFFLHF